MVVAFERVAPVLPVRNVGEALGRYRRLGFQARPYLELGFSTKDNPRYGYLTWGQVGRFRQTADTTYGKREFAYVDPDGNLVRVGSSVKR